MQSIEQLIDQIKQDPSAYKIPAFLCLVGLILVIGGIFSSNLLIKPKSKDFPKESLISQKDLLQIKVDVSGAIKNPGVYKLAKDSRVEDAVRISGGFDDKANKDYIAKKLNLSQKLSDGQKVYVPFENEQYQASQLGSQTTPTSQTGGLVGLNSGTQAELEALPGIGPVTAQKIIAGRPFNDVSELLSKKAVSKSVFDKIKELIDLH